MRLTVIPSDRTILLDGVPLTFDFAADANIHAIQWYGDYGTIEYAMGEPLHFTDPAVVQPYAAAHAAEQVRITAAAISAANTTEALAATAQAAQLAADVIAAKAYSKLTALRNMTPAQVQAWVAANVTNLAQAQDAIATLAIAVSILARRL